MSGAVDTIALRVDDAGVENIPTSDAEWRHWVAVTKTRNHVLGDPLLDWLDEWGAEAGYRRDEDLPGYSEHTDYGLFLRQKGREFEQHVHDALLARFPQDIIQIASGPGAARSLDAANATASAMAAGRPILFQAVLRNPQNRTYGIADLLVRSDWLNRLVAHSVVSEEEAAQPAPSLDGARHHYRVVEIKYTSLDLGADGARLKSSGSRLAYMAQLALYNQALARLQGLQAPAGYVLGRKWRFEKTTAGQKTRYDGTGAFDRLGRVDLDKTANIHDRAAAAVSWICELRADGGAWSALPEPSDPRLRPNAAQQQDAPWHQAKKQILAEGGDLTALWGVGPRQRDLALSAGITHWRDPSLDAAKLGVADSKARHLSQILAVHRDGHPALLPTRLPAEHAAPWIDAPRLEFYVDFETVNDLDDSFDAFPHAGGEARLFMIGCGHAEPHADPDAWRFECFIARDLDDEDEVRIVRDWLAWMRQVTDETLGQGAPLPRVLHWHAAETQTLQTACQSVARRHPALVLPRIPWFDFLNEVVKPVPITVRGALGFGLKDVARAMHALGLIDSEWQDGPADGLGAMVGAWRSSEIARETGCVMADTALMQSIAAYNETDCRVMWEIVAFLRQHYGAGAATP